MMRSILLLLALIASQISFGQENDGKRPSWSQGMPERTQAPRMKKLEVPSKSDVRETSRSEIDLQPLMEVEFENEFKSFGTNNEQSVKQPLVIEKIASESITEDGPALIEEPDPSEVDSDVVLADIVLTEIKAPETGLNTEPNTSVVYQWGVVRMVPVQLPRSMAQKYSSVLLKLSIDEDGEVLEIDPVLDSTPKSVMLHATRYVKQWRFDAPKKHGITQNLSRVFKVSLQARG